jgi:hypothetical protein
MRCRSAAILTLVLCIFFVACTESTRESTASSAQASTMRGAVMGMPFDGVIDRWGGASPWNHHRVVGGNWSADLYAPSGTPVAFHERTGAVGRVAAMGSSCRASSDPTYGGWQIQIDLSDATSGASLGTVFFLHVGNPSVKVGQTVRDGATLGSTYQWPYTSCYQVSNDGGTHVHFEVRSAAGSSCFARDGGAVGRGVGIARLGAGDAFGLCPGSIDVGPAPGGKDPCAGLIDSFYCGGHRVPGDASKLFHCKAGTLQPFERQCAQGCIALAGAEADRCSEDASSACVCDGYDQDGTPAHSETCGATVCGLDRKTWTCTPGNWSGGGPDC